MNRRWTPAVLGGATGVLTFVAYLPGLGRSLDFDSAETVGLFIRPGPPWAAFGRQAVFNNHPFFSFVEQLVRVTTGRVDPATLRIAPITFGAATVGTLVWYCARRFATLPALVAGALVAVNPTFSDLSREVRGYSLLSLCALVTSLIVVDELLPAKGLTAAFGRRSDVWYVVVASIGVATHLFMVTLLVVHVAMFVAAGALHRRWRERFVTIAALSALAYVALARSMLASGQEHGRLFQARLPLDVADVVVGGGWAAVVVAPVVVVGASFAVRRRSAFAGVAAGVVVFAAMWLLYRSAALTPRYFVFLVPLAALFAALAIARTRLLTLAVVVSLALAAVSAARSYTDDPTAYRQAAQLVRSVDDAGGRSCVVDVGVRPMQAYLDEPTDFTAVVQAEQLDVCDVLVVAAWWNTNAAWYEQDNDVIAAAQLRYGHRLVLRSRDPALVFSREPFSHWNVAT